MLPVLLSRAPLSDFAAPHAPILTGRALAAVRELEGSIRRFGLLAPLVVSRTRPGKPMTVLDGRLRLLAIQRLAFRGELPRSLATVPFMVADTATDTHPLALLSPIERFEQVTALRDAGHTVPAIADALYAPEGYIEDVLAVHRLSPRLRNSWFGGTLDLEQARAFATLPNPDAQDALHFALGPFAGAPDILDAIAAGATVLSVGPDEDDTLILPSRAAVESGSARIAARLAA